MTRVLGLAALLATLSVLTGGCALHHSQGWKRADLDRNRFDLGLHRGADTGEALGGWARYGEVVASGGTSRRVEGGDLYVVVRYQVDGPSGFGQSETRPECWRFTTRDGYAVRFREVGCP